MMSMSTKATSCGIVARRGIMSTADGGYDEEGGIEVPILLENLLCASGFAVGGRRSNAVGVGGRRGRIESKREDMRGEGEEQEYHNISMGVDR